jgi:Reverse transcriptase (RNA-dependent DNA polymerase)
LSHTGLSRTQRHYNQELLPSSPHLQTGESAAQREILYEARHLMGYQNVRLKEGDEWKAVFRTNHSLYKPLVMFFGLTNSPSTFQTMMNDIFQDLIMEGAVCIYLDDILTFTKGIKEHWCITRLVLE